MWNKVKMEQLDSRVKSMLLIIGVVGTLALIYGTFLLVRTDFGSSTAKDTLQGSQKQITTIPEETSPTATTETTQTDGAYEPDPTEDMGTGCDWASAPECSLDSGGVTASPSASPTASPTHPLRADLVLNKLRSRLIFDPPKELQIGETKTITLLLSPTKTVPELKHELEERGGGGQQRKIVTAEEIPTAQRMEARLTGEDFQIEALDSETQAITSDSSTAWRWDVKPTTWGKKRLHLTVSAILEVQGEPTDHTVTSYDRDVTVTVRMSQRLMSYASSIPSAITSGVILGMLGVIGAAFLGWWKGWWSRLLQRRRSGQD